LEEKDIGNIKYALQTCLKYEEHIERTGLPKGYYVKQIDMFAVLQLMQDMNNWTISYERKEFPFLFNLLPMQSSRTQMIVSFKQRL
jgi:hypothetical protein